YVKTRSTHTPSDHIDIISRTKATNLATYPIVPHIAIKSTIHPPSKLREPAGAGPTVSQGTVPRTVSPAPSSLQREIDRHGHDDRNGLAVKSRWREFPFAHRIERGGIEQRNRPQDFRILHFAVRSDRGLDDDDALHSGRLRDWRIDRLLILDLGRLLDVAPDADRRLRWWRWRPHQATRSGEHTSELPRLDKR